MSEAVNCATATAKCYAHFSHSDWSRRRGRPSRRNEIPWNRSFSIKSFDVFEAERRSSHDVTTSTQSVNFKTRIDWNEVYKTIRKVPQCDQIWQNIATLSNKSVFGTMWMEGLFGAVKFWTYFGKYFCCGQIFVIVNGQIMHKPSHLLVTLVFPSHTSGPCYKGVFHLRRCEWC